MKKNAIPTCENMVDDHFGHCAYIWFVKWSVLGIDLSEVDYVFISHGHSDHVFDVMRNVMGEKLQSFSCGYANLLWV